MRPQLSRSGPRCLHEIRPDLNGLDGLRWGLPICKQGRPRMGGPDLRFRTRVRLGVALLHRRAWGGITSTTMDLLAAISTHLSKFELPAIASIHVDASPSGPQLTVQLPSRGPSALVQGLLALADKPGECAGGKLCSHAVMNWCIGSVVADGRECRGHRMADESPLLIRT